MKNDLNHHFLNAVLFKTIQDGVLNYENIIPNFIMSGCLKRKDCLVCIESGVGGDFKTAIEVLKTIVEKVLTKERESDGEAMRDKDYKRVIHDMIKKMVDEYHSLIKTNMVDKFSIYVMFIIDVDNDRLLTTSETFPKLELVKVFKSNPRNADWNYIVDDLSIDALNDFCHSAVNYSKPKRSRCVRKMSSKK